MSVTTDTTRYYCLGYFDKQEQQYLGLDRWGIGDLQALLLNSVHLPDDKRTFVESYGKKYLADRPNEIKVLSENWIAETKQIIELSAIMSAEHPQLSRYLYHIIIAINMREQQDSIELNRQDSIIQELLRRDFSLSNKQPDFLGYDIVEPKSHWSVLNHASEWGLQSFRGNVHQLCVSLTEVYAWFDAYLNSGDPFALPSDENEVVALYEVVEII